MNIIYVEYILCYAEDKIKWGGPNMKRISIIMTLLLAATTAFAYGAEFSDVQSGHWAKSAISTMSEKHILKGYSDGQFQPNRSVTYGEFIKMVLLAGSNEDPGNAESPHHWASKYYDQAVEYKYFLPKEIAIGQLGLEMNRGDAALVVSAALGEAEIKDYDQIEANITDITAQTKHEYAIIKAYASGLITGYEDKTFRPQGTLTRAEAAMIIYRLMNQEARQLPEADKPTEENTNKGQVTERITTDGTAVIPDKIVKSSSLVFNYKNYYAEADARAKAEKWDHLPSDGVGFTDECEVYEDTTKWGLKLSGTWDGEDCSFDHTILGHIFLVKDGIIIEKCKTTPKFDSEGDYLGYQRSIAGVDIREIDYILGVFTPEQNKREARLMQVICNPFRNVQK